MAFSVHTLSRKKRHPWMSACDCHSGMIMSLAILVSVLAGVVVQIRRWRPRVRACLRLGRDPIRGCGRLARRVRTPPLAATVRRGGLPGRDYQALMFGDLGLNDGTVISLPAIPVAGRRAADGKRLRIGLASRHRDPLSPSG